MAPIHEARETESCHALDGIGKAASRLCGGARPTWQWSCTCWTKGHPSTTRARWHPPSPWPALATGSGEGAPGEGRRHDSGRDKTVDVSMTQADRDLRLAFTLTLSSKRVQRVLSHGGMIETPRKISGTRASEDQAWWSRDCS